MPRVEAPADANWPAWKDDDGCYSSEQVQRCILLDIRRELQKLNAVLHCANFMAIPFKLDRIVKNTHKPRKYRRRKVAS